MSLNFHNIENKEENQQSLNLKKHNQLNNSQLQNRKRVQEPKHLRAAEYSLVPQLKR